MLRCPYRKPTQVDEEIIRYEDQGKTVIEGDRDSEISQRFFDLANLLLEDEAKKAQDGE